MVTNTVLDVYLGISNFSEEQKKAQGPKQHKLQGQTATTAQERCQQIDYSSYNRYPENSGQEVSYSVQLRYYRYSREVNQSNRQ